MYGGGLAWGIADQVQRLGAGSLLVHDIRNIAAAGHASVAHQLAKCLEDARCWARLTLMPRLRKATASVRVSVALLRSLDMVDTETMVR